MAELQTSTNCPPELQSIVFEERERHRFTIEDVASAAKVLGFGHDEALGIEYDSEVEDRFLEDAWRDCIKRSWQDSTGMRQREVNDAFKILAEHRGSVHLHLREQSERNAMMNPEKAYLALDVPLDVDEAMLLIIYGMRVSSPLCAWVLLINNSRYKMRLCRRNDYGRHSTSLPKSEIAADFDSSSRLVMTVSTIFPHWYFILNEVKSAGDVAVPTRPDIPRGLNQLGNTCYLNSLLQVGVIFILYSLIVHFIACSISTL